MGNILSSFFSRKQHENSKKSNVSANNIHNCQRNENDEKLCRSSTKKSKKSNIDPNKVLHNTYDQQNYCEPNQNDSVLKSKNGESESDNQKDHSPFQRDFYQPPHEILVPLEKYRPRRSNIRRSARINPIKSNHLEEFNVDIAPKLYEGETISKPPKSDYKPESSNVNDNQNDEKVENDKEDENIVDDLDPSERTKVVRSKISELLRRQQQQQQQQQHQSALLLNNQRKFKSVFEPGLDYYKSSTNDIQLDLPEKIVDDETSPTNEETPNDVLRRPKKTMMAIHGNALLIDELKKRQSHFHESREPHHHHLHHHHQINSMASVQ